LEDIVFNAESAAGALASASLQGGNPNNLLASLPVMYGAGLLTSVSPCVWGLLPLTLTYISQAAGERPDKRAALPTIVFALGLASVFCTLGIAAAQLGGVLGSASSASSSSSSAGLGFVLPVLSNAVCLLMGLQLLDLIRLPLLSLDFSAKRTRTTSPTTSNEPILIDGTGKIMSSNNSKEDKSDGRNGGSLLRVFLLGGSSALVASPCATPVLTSILAFVAGSSGQSVLLGALLLLVYTLGYSTPLLWIAGTGGQALARLREGSEGGSSSSSSQFGAVSQWVTPVTAGVLLWYGTNGMLTTFFGDPSLAGMVIP
jgi:cytochrome c-type biogenesis protein